MKNKKLSTVLRNRVAYTAFEAFKLIIGTMCVDKPSEKRIAHKQSTKC